jgi:hypothetical protein
MTGSEGKLGPKMNALPPMRRAFVRALMNQGTRNATEAYKAAGYSQSPGNHQGGNASILMHDDAVQEAIQEEAKRRVCSMLPLAVHTVGEIMENPQEGGATRLKAATVVMDRGGVHAVSERITTEAPLERDPDQIKRIMALAQLLGVPIEKLVGSRLKMIEAPIDEPMYTEFSTEGLDGLI